MELIAIGRWLAVLAGLWLAGLPVAAVVFPEHPHLRRGFAVPIAVVVVSIGVYWLGQVYYGPVTVWIGALGVGMLGVAAVRRDVPVRWRAVREPAAVFLVAFCYMLVLRGAFPGITPGGGEQFLDFGLLNAVLRADHLPPEDPWFAGRTVRYYYGGYLSTAVLTTLSGVKPAVAFNLAVGTYYALLVTGAYAIAGSLAAARGGSRRTAGVLGVYLVGVAGNLAPTVRLLFGLVPGDLARRFGRFAFEGIRADYDTAVAEATRLSTFDFWRARHVIEGVPTVFPFWTFLNGDLRPHMMSAPFLLLVVALAIATYRTPADRGRRRLLLLVGALPPVVGYLGLTNTWSLPTALGVVFLTVAFVPAAPSRLVPSVVRKRANAVFRSEPPGQSLDGPRGVLRREVGRLGVAGAVTGIVGVLSVAWIAPYLLLATPTNEGIGFFPPRSPFGPLVLVHGLFVALYAIALAPSVASLIRSRDRPRIGLAVTVIATTGLVWVGLALDFGALALCGPVLVTAWVLLRTRRDVGFAGVLLIAGLGLVLIGELAYARVWPHDPNAIRWNTMYKISMQVWLLLGVGSGAVLARALPAMTRPARAGDRQWSALGLVSGLRVLGIVVVVVLLVSAGTVGVIGTAGWVEEYLHRPPDENTLDGTAYVADEHPGEMAAIAWLCRSPGTPTIVTAPGDHPYQWRSAPSSLTGIPTLVGWRHVSGFHGHEGYSRRVAAVQTIYTGNATARRTRLVEFNVTYVYVGPIERDRYGAISFADLAAVRVAHRSGTVTVYRIDASVMWRTLHSRRVGHDRATAASIR